MKKFFPTNFVIFYITLIWDHTNIRYDGGYIEITWKNYNGMFFDGKVELTYKNMNCVFTFENDVLDGKYVIVINNEFKLQG